MLVKPTEDSYEPQDDDEHKDDLEQTDEGNDPDFNFFHTIYYRTLTSLNPLTFQSHDDQGNS